MRYIIFNFKTYSEASGENAVRLAGVAANVELPDDLQIIICPQAADIYRVREHFPHIQIWAQHIDPIDPGKNTGWTSPETLVMAGATGTLINHSEHPLAPTDIEGAIKEAKERNLMTCVAVASIEQATQVQNYQADMITYEPPKLIGSQDSLLDTNPELAQAFIQKLPSPTRVILGAGIKDKADVTKALDLGYAGVLIGSGFVLAEHPDAFLQEILSAFAS